MDNIFTHSHLEQPKDTDYLWRFIKPEHIDSFLSGEIYFASLLEFEDYYEAISPMHHLCLSTLRRIHDKELPDDPPKPDLRSVFQGASWGFQTTIMFHHLKEIVENDDKDLQKDKFFEALEQYESIKNDHDKTQSSTYASCWFIGDGSESALMWKSYSKPGGIAIRIQFAHFKRLVQGYFKTTNPTGVKSLYGGKLHYYRYLIDIEWISKFKIIPIGFIKHASFCNEQEYRLVIEKNAHKFNKLQRIFFADYFDIILHPSSDVEEYQAMKKKIEGAFKPTIYFSELTYRVPQLSDQPGKS